MVKLNGKLLSDQITRAEIDVILNELQRIKSSSVIGDVVELGCYLGTSSVFIASELADTERKYYVYDSFEGLPKKSSNDDAALGGQFREGELFASKKQFMKNLRQAGVMLPIIKKGWFSDLGQEDLPDKISFAFFDGDYYDSIKDSFRLIKNKMSPGSTILVHDYTNPNLPGVYRAVNEWLAQNPQATMHIAQSLAIIYIKR